MTSNYIRNLEFSVVNLVKKNDKQVNIVNVRTREEMVHCWMTNLVRQEGQEEKVINLARRCMTRFLDTLEEESLDAWSCSELLAATCLLVTSKIVSVKPLAAKVLLHYAGSDFTMEELMVSSPAYFCILSISFWNVTWKLRKKNKKHEKFPDKLQSHERIRHAGDNYLLIEFLEKTNYCTGRENMHFVKITGCPFWFSGFILILKFKL